MLLSFGGKYMGPYLVFFSQAIFSFLFPGQQASLKAKKMDG
jgi:hypothetical protein